VVLIRVQGHTSRQLSTGLSRRVVREDHGMDLRRSRIIKSSAKPTMIFLKLSHQPQCLRKKTN